jgi:acetylornithine deacetylase/succinyl-diaminopimelate desuccinylase-like protein
VDEAWFAELAELLRIPSVSADAAHADDVRRAAEWVAAFVRGAGGTAELEERNGRPLVLGEIPASRDPDTAPTVMVYGHFDVQPPDPLEEWESPPFELVQRGEWLYGRGVADDKGQLYLMLKAAELLAAEGALPVNVRIACDGEEEVGGHSIVEFLEDDERGADACIIFDGGMIARDVPAFEVATRGLAYFHLRIRTGERDLHSGVFGGAALNATHALMQTLAAVMPQNGRLPEPLRAGITPPTEQELADWAELPPGTGELAGQGARPADLRAAEEFYLRTFAEPSVDVHGIEGGSPRLQKTVLPVLAEANLSIRLAPGQDVQTIADTVERLLSEAVPAGAELAVQRFSSAPAGLIAPDSKAVQLGLDAFERALGRRPLLVRTGGTLPIVPALADQRIPTILTGFALMESNIHSPNERLLVDYVPLGVAAARELFVSLGGLSGKSPR